MYNVGNIKGITYMCAHGWQLILTLNPATDKLTHTLWQVSTVSVLFTAMLEIHDVKSF